MATKDIILRVTADIAAYKQNMVDVVGATEKAATRAALKMQQEFYKSAKSTDDALESTTRKAEEQAQRIAEAAKISAAAEEERLQVLSKIDPKLQALVIKEQMENAALETRANALGISTSKLQQYEAGLKGTAATAGTAAKKTDNVRHAVLGLGHQLSDVASQLSTGTNPLTILIQQGPQALGAVAGVTGGLGLLAYAVGAAVAIGVPLYGVYKSFSEAADMAARSSAALAGNLEQLNQIQDITKQSIIDIEFAYGNLNKEQVANLKNIRDLNKAYAESVTVPLQKISELNQKQGGFSATVGDMAQGLGAMGPAGKILAMAIDGVTTSTSELNEETAIYQGRVNRAVVLTKEAAAATEELDKATIHKANADKHAKDAADAHAKALREQAAAIRASIAAMDEDQRLTDALRAGVEALRQAGTSAYLAQLKGVEALVAQREIELKQLQAIYQQTLLNAGSDADRLAASEQYERAKAAVTSKYEAQIKAERDKSAEDEKDRLNKLRDQALDVVGKIGDVAGKLSSTMQENGDRSLAIATELAAQLAAGEEYYTAAQEKQLKRRIKAQENAARKAFATAQAAALAEAAINTAVGITKAIPNPFMMAFAAAAGAIEIAGIASQKAKFHSGKMPDEVSITRREAQGGILPSSAVQALGPRNVERALNGQSPSGETSFKIIYERGQFNRFISDYSRSGGPITMSKTASVGHRTGRRGTSG